MWELHGDNGGSPINGNCCTEAQLKSKSQSHEDN